MRVIVGWILNVIGNLAFWGGLVWLVIALIRDLDITASLFTAGGGLFVALIGILVFVSGAYDEASGNKDRRRRQRINRRSF